MAGTGRVRTLNDANGGECDMAKTLTDDDLSRAFGQLGIPPTTDMASIIEAFRARAQIVHPDRSAEKSPVPMQRLVEARDVLKTAAESGFLKAYVARVSVAWDPFEGAVDSGTVYGVPRKVEDAFPDMNDIVIVHRVSPGTYVLWASRSIVANNAKARTVCRVLREMAGDAAEAPDVMVWVFVPGERKMLVQLRDLPEILDQLDQSDRGAKKPASKKDAETPDTPEIADAPDADEPSTEEIKAVVLKQDWRGARNVYVIYVGATDARKPAARVFLIRKRGMHMLVDLIGKAPSSEGALSLLTRRGENPDVTPVFLIHAANPGEVLRMGSA